MTVVTQFITEDGTEQGDLAEIRRLYVQNNNVIANSKVIETHFLPSDKMTKFEEITNPTQFRIIVKIG